MKAVQLIFGVGTLFFVLLAASGWSALNIVILALTLLFLFQGVIAVYAMLYSWESRERLAGLEPPLPGLERPKHSFTLIIPARHEERVIGDTLRAMSQLDYPQSLLEVLVVIRTDDFGTIREANRALREINRPNFRLVVFDGGPINKAHALNVGLFHARNEVVGVFDAEDEPHPQILHLVDLKMARDQVDVVQAGVQLINFDSTWFSALACLEYYFWYKSVLPFFSRLGSTPLGGNTVFFKKHALIDAAGWDDLSLTEDADLGVRLSLAGYKIATIYQERISTLEEAPPDVEGLIRQRSRWDYGFLQIIFRGDWLRFAKLSQQFLILYLFLQPFVHLVTLVATVVLPYLVLRVKVPLALAMLSFVPGYVLLLQLGIFVTGLVELARQYRRPLRFGTLTKVVVGYIPYQAILGVAFLRAAMRYLLGFSWWEKTVHVNAHRPAVLPLFARERAAALNSGPGGIYSAPLERFDHDVANRTEMTPPSLNGVIYLGTPNDL